MEHKPFQPICTPCCGLSLLSSANTYRTYSTSQGLQQALPTHYLCLSLIPLQVALFHLQAQRGYIAGMRSHSLRRRGAGTHIQEKSSPNQPLLPTSLRLSAYALKQTNLYSQQGGQSSHTGARHQQAPCRMGSPCRSRGPKESVWHRLGSHLPGEGRFPQTMSTHKLHTIIGMPEPRENL